MAAVTSEWMLPLLVALLGPRALLGQHQVVSIARIASCGSGRFSCGDGRHVPDSVRCDWVKDCDNGEDEEGCPMCGCDAFSCGNGDCRRKVDVCDGKMDCPNGKDEEGCSGRPSHLFSCGDGIVILKEAMCDGVPDCPRNKADEENCTVCTMDAFLCDGICWRTSRLCDGLPDCSDGEDEKHCSSSTFPSSSSPEPSDAQARAARAWSPEGIIVTAVSVILLVISISALGITCYVLRCRRTRRGGEEEEKSSYGPSVAYSKDSPKNMEKHHRKYDEPFLSLLSENEII